MTVKISFEMEDVDYQNLIMILREHNSNQYMKLVSPDFNEAEKDWIKRNQKYVETNIINPIIKGYTKMKKIEEFQGDFRFLSNFYPSPFEYEGKQWPTVEHAFQALKSLSEDEQETIRNLSSPTEAKKAGKQVNLRTDWEDVKVPLMRSLVYQKFLQNEDLKNKLLETEDAILEEGNVWSDFFWGVCPPSSGNGQNKLGKILMEIRSKI